MARNNRNDWFKITKQDFWITFRAQRFGKFKSLVPYRSEASGAVIKSTFLILFLVGIFFRFYRLNNIPISLFGDEIDLGLQAKSILQTGKDYLGNSYPVMLHSFSEYRL